MKRFTHFPLSFCNPSRRIRPTSLPVATTVKTTTTTTTTTARCFSSWDGHGTDLLGDSLQHSNTYGAPKVILHGHSSTGFDVNRILKKMDEGDKSLDKSAGIVHLSGSILCFPTACYMWNVSSTQELTVESLLSPVVFYRPKLEYLFLGSNKTISPALIKDIRDQLAVENNELVVEPMDLANAMGTFNILNGEDRMVCAALILDNE